MRSVSVIVQYKSGDEEVENILTAYGDSICAILEREIDPELSFMLKPEPLTEGPASLLMHRLAFDIYIANELGDKIGNMDEVRRILEEAIFEECPLLETFTIFFQIRLPHLSGSAMHYPARQS